MIPLLLQLGGFALAVKERDVDSPVFVASFEPCFVGPMEKVGIEDDCKPHELLFSIVSEEIGLPARFCLCGTVTFSAPSTNAVRAASPSPLLYIAKSQLSGAPRLYTTRPPL